MRPAVPAAQSACRPGVGGTAGARRGLHDTCVRRYWACGRHGAGSHQLGIGLASGCRSPGRSQRRQRVTGITLARTMSRRSVRRHLNTCGAAAVWRTCRRPVAVRCTASLNGRLGTAHGGAVSRRGSSPATSSVGRVICRRNDAWQMVAGHEARPGRRGTAEVLGCGNWWLPADRRPINDGYGKPWSEFPKRRAPCAGLSWHASPRNLHPGPLTQPTAAVLR